MRILYLSQYFPPEIGATQTRAYEMASYFVRIGHSVTMLTEIPNHPSGVIPPEYRRKLYTRNQLSGIDVIRVWVYATPDKNFRKRMLFYLSYLVNAIIAGVVLAKGDYDVVFATSPPLFTGWVGLTLSRLKKTRLVFEVRDLWPESAIKLGELSNRYAIMGATRIEEACYKSANKIVVVTNGIRDHLAERGVPIEKIEVIPNGSNTELFKFNPFGRERIRQQLGLEDKFVAIYAGIHGIAQGLETVIEAARMLRDQSDIIFLFVGEGPQKSRLQTLTSSYNLANILFVSEQPREIIPDYLSAADVALVPLRKVDLFKSALPSKIFDAWACERPVLLSVEGEARNILEKAEGGQFVPPEDPQEMVLALTKLRSSPELRQSLGLNGRLFTLQHYSRQAQAEKLSTILESLHG